MRVLITGANGFIGSYLVDYFMRKNYEVIATSRKFHDSVLKKLDRAEHFELDVLNTQKLQNIDIKADIIIHTSTANDVVSKNTLNGVELSAVGTKNILDFAVRNKIPKCIVFSTLQVYGTELYGDIDEESPLYFQNEYGINHLLAEMYAEMYSRQGKVQCVSVRPSNVYGDILTDAFNRWSLVPGCFCKEAVESGTITIKSSGLQMRNFVHLENISRAIECIARKFPVNYECFNLASSQVYTIAEVAMMAKKIYEENFSRYLNVIISGAEPLKTNTFNVSLSKLQAIGFVEDKNFSVRSVITSIFKYLV